MTETAAFPRGNGYRLIRVSVQGADAIAGSAAEALYAKKIRPKSRILYGILFVTGGDEGVGVSLV